MQTIHLHSFTACKVLACSRPICVSALAFLLCHILQPHRHPLRFTLFFVFYICFYVCLEGDPFTTLTQKLLPYSKPKAAFSLNLCLPVPGWTKILFLCTTSRCGIFLIGCTPVCANIGNPVRTKMLHFHPKAHTSLLITSAPKYLLNE